MKVNKILKVFTVMIITIMCTIVFSGCGNEKKDERDNAYKVPLETYFSGIKEKNLEKVLQAFPDFMDMETRIIQDDIDQFYRNYETEYGQSVSIDYSLEEPVRYEGDDLEEFKAEIIATNENVSKDDIEDAYFVPVTIIIKGENTEEGQDNEDGVLAREKYNFYSFKYKDVWYVR